MALQSSGAYEKQDMGLTSNKIHACGIFHEIR